MTLQVNLEKQQNSYSVSFDKNRFEKMASVFGFYNLEFIKSLAKAERDVKAKRFSKAKSLADMF